METKLKVNSWDVFDTLIGRRCFYPDEIFRIIEKQSGINNFYSIRKHCECITLSNYDDIYIKMLDILGVDTSNKLKILEFETELEYIFPINENINKVKDGDILVSDNYYSKEFIYKLLQKAGFNKNVEIYVTYGGKSNGTIWNIIKQKYDILFHTGDNMHSDIHMANNNGVNAIFFNKDYNDIENYINIKYTELAKFCRTLRLKNPYNKDHVSYQLWNLESNFNVPILILFISYLNQYCEKNNYETLLFCTRDCCHLFKIFKHFYPKYNSIYFHSSRQAYLTKSNDYKEYLISLSKNKTLVIDLCGTGKSGNLLFEEFSNIKRFFFWFIDDNKNIDYMFKSPGNNSLLEILNYDKIGSLTDVKKEKDIFIDIRKPIKYDYSTLDFMDLIIEDIINYATIPNDFSIDTILYLIKYFDDKNTEIKKIFNHDGDE